MKDESNLNGAEFLSILEKLVSDGKLPAPYQYMIDSDYLEVLDWRILEPEEIPSYTRKLIHLHPSSRFIPFAESEEDLIAWQWPDFTSVCRIGAQMARECDLVDRNFKTLWEWLHSLITEMEMRVDS
ncbi:hypothetical protein KDL29_01485 [bacterium]|nr:hypothetical protein [bacterium]